MDVRLFVNNLGSEITPAEVVRLFAAWNVHETDVHIPVDRANGRPRGFAFVQVASQDAAREAIARLNNTEYRRNRLFVDIARGRKSDLVASTRAAKAVGGPAQERQDVFLWAPVYLCADSPSITPLSASRPSDVVDGINVVSQGLIAALAAPVSSVAAMQASNWSFHITDLFIHVDDIVRLFVWVFYSALRTTRRELPRSVVNVLAGGGIGRAVTRANFGDLANQADTLSKALAAGSPPAFLGAGIEWWQHASGPLKELNGKRNEIVHAAAERVDDGHFLDLMTRLAELSTLPWVLIADRKPSRINLVGPTSRDWREIDVPITDDSVALDPLIIYRAGISRLDVFRTEVRGAPGYARRGGPIEPRAQAMIAADEATSRRFELAMPVAEWEKKRTRASRWSTACETRWTNQKFHFDDVFAATSRTREVRDPTAAAIVSRITDGLSSKRNGVVIEGPAGVGKSAVMTILHDKLQNRAICPYFFFRDPERDVRCRLEEFFESTAYQIAKALDTTAEAESNKESFETALTQFANRRRLGEESRPIVFLVDGVDELPAPDLPGLLAAVGIARPNVFWVLAGRHLHEVQQLVNQNVLQRVDLHELDRVASRIVLREELSKCAPQLGDQIRAAVMSDSWIDAVLDNPDAGLPLYLTEVARFVASEPQRVLRADEIAGTLKKLWASVVKRTQASHSAFNMLTLLSLAFAPLRIDEIAALVAAPPEGFAVALDRYPFVAAAGGWTIDRQGLREYIRTSKDPVLRTARAALSQGLLHWCGQWSTSSSTYPLEYLAQHLAQSPDRWDDFKRLAFDTNFLQAQVDRVPSRPELPAETVQLALRVACERGALADALMLAMHQAQQLFGLGQSKAIAAALSSRNYSDVRRRVSALEDVREQRAWRLIAAADALLSGANETALQLVGLSAVLRPVIGASDDRDWVTLALFAGAGAQAGVDVRQPVSEIAGALLSAPQKQHLVEHLPAANSVEPFQSFLADSRKRRGGVRALARALGRQGHLDHVRSLADVERDIREDVRVEGAVGLAESGEYASAAAVVQELQHAGRRCEALALIATEAACRGADEDEVLARLTDVLRACPGTGSPTGGTLEKLFSDIVASVRTMQDRPRRARVLASLGIIQEKLDIAGEDLVVEAENSIAQLLVPDALVVYVRSTILRAYLRVLRWDDAKRVALGGDDVARRHMESEISAAEWAASVQRGARGDRRHRTWVAAVLARENRCDDAIDVLISILTEPRPATADAPALWGRPRVLGVVAAALCQVGARDRGEQAFSDTSQALRHLKARGRETSWQRDRAYGFLNLAEAHVVAGDDREVVKSVLAEAQEAATRDDLPLRKRHPDTVAEILAEAWTIAKKYDEKAARQLLDLAVLVAREGSALQRVKGLSEIARRQARVGEREAARETLKEAGESTAAGGSEAYAEWLKGLARARQLEGLEEKIADALRTVQGPERDIVGRAEVERLLGVDHPDFARAERGLDGIKYSKARSHAARSIAEAYASVGRYDDALRLVRQDIVEGQSELIADVAEVIARHVQGASAMAEPEREPLKEAARKSLLELLQQSARYLDGTYRVIASIITSEAFALDLNTLLQLEAFGSAQHTANASS